MNPSNGQPLPAGNGMPQVPPADQRRRRPAARGLPHLPVRLPDVAAQRQQPVRRRRDDCAPGVVAANGRCAGAPRVIPPDGERPGDAPALDHRRLRSSRAVQGRRDRRRRRRARSAAALAPLIDPQKDRPCPKDRTPRRAAATPFLTDVADAARACAPAHRAGRDHRELRRRPRHRREGAERGARHRDRLRAALQAPLLHGAGHRVGVGEGRIPRARERGAGPCRPDRRAHRPAGRRARPQSGRPRPSAATRSTSRARTSST